MPTGPDVGARITAARRRLGISREELAVRAGVSWSAIAQIETGRRPNPRADTVAALARGLGVGADHLLGSRRLAPSLLDHQALMYDGAEDFARQAGAFIQEGLEAGEPVLVAAAPEREPLLRERLGPLAGDIDYVASPDWYGDPAAATAAYRDFTTERIGDGADWVRILGGGPWAAGQTGWDGRWARFEAMVNLALAPFPLTLACPYDRSRLQEETLATARATHPCCLVEGRRVVSEDYEDPVRRVLGE